MREIKFRAWDRVSREMIGAERLTLRNGILAEGFVFQASKRDFMQFTGLHDKNGKEIYEGDVVRHYDYPRQKFSVEYIAPSFEARNTKDGTLRPMWHNGKLTDYEIIGNIYSNPELLNHETPNKEESGAEGEGTPTQI